MVGDLVTAYYGDRARNLGKWENRWAVMSYDYILSFETIPSSSKIKAPALVVHSDGAITPNAAALF